MSKTRPSIFFCLAIVGFLAVAAATFPGGWGPRAATWAARRALAFGEPARTRLTVERLSARQLIVRDVALGGLPGEPAFDSLVVRYSPWGLLRRRIDSVALSPVRLDPGSLTKPLPASTPRRPSAPPRCADPLQGWRIGTLQVSLAPLDLGQFVPSEARAWLPNATVEASLSLDGTDGAPLEARLDGRAFGGTLSGRLLYDSGAASGRVDVAATPDFGAFRPGHALTAEVAFGFSCGKTALRTAASGTAGFADSPWRVAVNAEAEGGTFSARIERAPATVEPDDPVLAALIAALPLPQAVSVLSLGATLSASAEARNNVAGGAPAWKVEASVSECAVDARLGGDFGLALRRGGFDIFIDGIGTFWRLHPTQLWFSALHIGRATLSDGRIQLLAEDDTLMVTDARAGFCGGFLRLYALSLNMERMSSGFTILLDGLDAGGVLAMFPEVGGTASGTLNGKVPLALHSIDTVPELRLLNAFLHSPPGKVGVLRLANTEPLVTYLTAAGVPAPTCRSLGEALHDLDYDVLRFDLSRDPEEGKRLEIGLVGSSTNGGTKTPVDLHLALRGDLERLLNLGIRAGTMGGERH